MNHTLWLSKWHTMLHSLNIQSHQLRQELSRIFLTEPLYFSLRHRCLKTWMLIQLKTIFKQQVWDSNPSCMVVELDTNLTCIEDTNRRTICYHIVLLGSISLPFGFYISTLIPQIIWSSVRIKSFF